MMEMKKWLALAQYLHMDKECQFSFDILLAMIDNGRIQGFTFSSAW